MAVALGEKGQDTPEHSAKALKVVRHEHFLLASAERGRQLVQSKGCLACHSVRGKGGKISADFATSKVVGSHPSSRARNWPTSRATFNPWPSPHADKGGDPKSRTNIAGNIG
jgi:hypothetical protein